MRHTTAFTGLLLLLVALRGLPSAHGDELVQVTPHRAAAGLKSNEDTPPLLGFLARPAGPGRFPAVILLHACTGFSEHDTAAAAALKSWGYVALALDTLGDANMCAEGGGAVAEVFDAYAALRYLTAQSFVAGNRVAVMGYSMGGIAALLAVDKDGIGRPHEASFRAAVTYYPLCQFSTGILTTPTLILIGERDDWASADACRKLAAHESDIGVTRVAGTGASVDLIVYPDATHAFDFKLPTRRNLGHFEQYNEEAARDAEIRVRAFLRQQLGDQPETPDTPNEPAQSGAEIRH
jgi:dienelactone hydrolase